MKKVCINCEYYRKGGNIEAFLCRATPIQTICYTDPEKHWCGMGRWKNLSGTYPLYEDRLDYPLLPTWTPCEHLHIPLSDPHGLIRTYVAPHQKEGGDE